MQLIYWRENTHKIMVLTTITIEDKFDYLVGLWFIYKFYLNQDCQDRENLNLLLNYGEIVK
ncbi:MAG: hypothetical protein F6K48_22410 [Okeania sp. SIO3H1]|uniref:hypothetical protein n=1 Tax=Okeania sp. SIO1I7 TaxID=2607772 RepID=UPI0013CBFAE5|nr:hypothetical protein [Okeania sp. SIO1I7]NEN91506.1 hypothetical protein [Okeania sp. SIO3H1]NET27933.1 hypothetical protein [Okeania sp. SIO1I7]